jgi:anti-sigma28 factor (negative regulator of flagellin synthesis)
MSLFKQDPALALAKTEDKISSITANIEALQAQRAQRLLEAEDPSEIVRLDQSIEVEERNLTILADRVRALREEIRRGEYENREDKRKAAIKKLSAHLAKREAIAAKLEAAITEVGDLYDQLLAPDYAADVWPFPSPPFADFDRAPVAKEIGWAMHSLVSGHGLPMPNSSGLGVFGIKAEGIAATVRSQNAGILARAESAPIHTDLLEEPAA